MEKVKINSPTNPSFLNPVFQSREFYSTLSKHCHKHFLLHPKRKKKAALWPLSIQLHL